jgi:ABC-2 type transport system permease protein
VNTISLALTDSSTMLRRNLLRMRRYPSMTLLLIGLPILFLLLFVYVFGGTLGAGLSAGVAPGADSRAEYLNYVTPAILLMAAAAAAQGTAISVAMDRTEGILARFRTMAISPSSVLAGHVLGSVIQSLIAMGALLGVAVLLGFRPDASPLGWLALVGLLTLTAFALTWLCVAFGLVSKSVETASNLPSFLIILPFLSSGFVPVESMPAGLAWFAEHQPFTPIIETVRGLFMGDADVATALVAVGWCVLIALVGYLWSRALFRRDAAR